MMPFLYVLGPTTFFLLLCDLFPSTCCCLSSVSIQVVLPHPRFPNPGRWVGPRDMQEVYPRRPYFTPSSEYFSVDVKSLVIPSPGEKFLLLHLRATMIESAMTSRFVHQSFPICQIHPLPLREPNALSRGAPLFSVLFLFFFPLVLLFLFLRRGRISPSTPFNTTLSPS